MLTSLNPHYVTIPEETIPVDPNFWKLIEGADIRLEVTGSMGVGKSAFILHYSHDFFSGDLFEFDSNQEESCLKKVMLNKSSKSRSSYIYLDIFDSIEDNEKYNSWGPVEKTIQGFLLCFSLVDRKSFNYVMTRLNRLERILQKRKEDIPVVLVGTKKDLEEDRSVPYEEALEFSKSIGKPYVEVSSKSGENISAPFEKIIEMILHDEAISYHLKNQQTCRIV